MLAITMGAGRTVSRGRRRTLDEWAVEALHHELLNQPPERDSWWSPHTWQEDRRSTASWEAASGVAVDVDYYDDGKHVALPDNRVQWLTELCREGEFPGNLGHLTPRGLRLVFVFDASVTSADLYRLAAMGAGALVTDAIQHLRLDGLQVDERALLDVARIVFSPHAIVDGVSRSAMVHVMSGTQPSARQLADLAPKNEVPASARPSSADTELEEAARRYNRERARELPRPGRGRCPVCGHKGCFGRLPSEPTRWACFSASHAGAGRQLGSCWSGDLLDLDAFDAGTTPVKHLRAQGYLARPAQPAANLPVGALFPSKGGEPPPPPPDAPDAPEAPPAPPELPPFARLCRLLREEQSCRQLLGDWPLGWNEMDTTLEVGARAVTDHDLLAVREHAATFLDGRGKPIRVARQDVFDGVEVVAHERSFHPVRQWLRGLTWDKTPRLDLLAESALGAAEDERAARYLRKFAIGAVARVMRPGCKLDTCLILSGPQGVGKSSFFRELAGREWWGDSAVDVHSKDAVLALRGVWVLEWAELQALIRAEHDAVKAFLSSAVDRIRLPYGRTQSTLPRASVIVGTTNEDAFLTDTTGHRRMWPVRVERVDLGVVREWREQLWAEARAAYEAGEPWWLSREQEAERQEDLKSFERLDPWIEPVEEWLGVREAVRTIEVLTGALGMRVGDVDYRDQRRVASVMRRLGWELAMVRDAEGRNRKWRRPKP